MRTFLECTLFLDVWKDSIPANDLAKIRSFIDGSSVMSADSPKNPRALNLQADFLKWFESDYDVARFDRIWFTDGSEELIGVVRNVNRRTGSILLYCAYSYNRRVLLLDKPTCSLGYCMRTMTESEHKRLKRELSKVGMVWKDKLHRLEPERVKAEEGNTYWYISDSLQIIADREDMGRKAHLRYIAGNYFTDYGNALEVCDRIRELLKCNLAKIDSSED